MKTRLATLIIITSGMAVLSGCTTPPPGNVEMYPVLGPHPSFSQQLQDEVNLPDKK